MRMSLQNNELWQGVPFVLQIETSKELPQRILVEPKNAIGMADFWVPVTKLDEGRGISELSLQDPGIYVASIDHDLSTFEFVVKERSNLGFASEFFILGALSLIIAGGILIWIVKKKKKNA